MSSEGVCVLARGGKSPQGMGAEGDVCHSLAISCLTRALADEEGIEPLGTQRVGGGQGRCCPSRDAGCGVLHEAMAKNHIWISQHHSKLETQCPHS